MPPAPPPDCLTFPRFSSRVCERGTASCTVVHGTPAEREARRLALSTAAAACAAALDALSPIGAGEQLTPNDRDKVDQARAALTFVELSCSARHRAAVEALRRGEG